MLMALVSGYAKAFEDTSSLPLSGLSQVLPERDTKVPNRSFPKCTSAGCTRQIELR